MSDVRTTTEIPDEADWICPGHCNDKYRAAEATGNPHARTPHPGEPTWCFRCQDSIYFNLARIPDLTVHAASRTDGRLNTGTNDEGDRWIKGNCPHRPTQSPAWDTGESTIRWAHAWTETLADHLGHHGPLHVTTAGLPVRNLTETVRYLTTHFARVMSAPFAEDFGTETVREASALERAAGRDRYVQRLRKLRCPHCETKSMVRMDGAEQIDCTLCHNSWPASDYNRFVTIVQAGRAG